jgi:parallel beta-helix repeat protein
MRRYVLTMRREARPDTRRFRVVVGFGIALGALCALLALAGRRVSLSRAAKRTAANDVTAPAAPRGTDFRRPLAPATLGWPTTRSETHRRERRPRARRIRRLGGTLVGLTALALALGLPSEGNADTGTADEIHYTFTGPTSVTFDWRGTATAVQYGPTASYGATVTAHAPTPMPFSSAGPFQEADLTGLQAGITYHYSIGGGPDTTFRTEATGSFRFDVAADVGSSAQYPNVGTTMAQIAADRPDFVLMVGDLTYGNVEGQAAVDQHFNDAMAWSQTAAYMPAWGNHEWETPAADDLRNYKGRFALPSSQGALGSPGPGCCDEDWSWFDAGGVRFISYPEPYSGASTWTAWASRADAIMAAAQSNPSVNYIVTFGHRPAYSTGFHPGEASLASVLDSLGDKYSKYVLNLNGHSHDYERFQPIHRITHITTGGGGSALEPPWASTDPRTAFRAMHLEHLRVDVTGTGMRIDAICGPPTSQDDVSCAQGSVMDSYTIGTPPPLPPPTSTIYVDNGNAGCSDVAAGTQTAPLCTISAAAARTTPGTTVVVNSGTYNEQVTVRSGTAASPVTFTATPGANVTVTGKKYGFYVSNQSYVTIQGFKVTGTTSDGFHLSSNSSNIKMIGNDVSFAGQPASGKTAKGIYAANVTNSVISFNRVHDNSSYGIYLDSSSACQLLNNQTWANAQVYQRAASGIRLYGSIQNTISSNVSHDNEDSGIELYTGSNNNLAIDNLSYGNGDHGIDNYSSTGNRIISNSVYKNVTAGINAEGGSTGTTIANNISVDNGIKSPRTRSDIRVDQASTSGTTMDYDLVYLTTPDTLLIWNSVSYSSLAAFRSATGQEAHGVVADPQWKNPAGNDFHLTAGSSAIDSANSGASGQPSNDEDGNPRVDDRDVANSGAGPRAYDDRGAYEFQWEPSPDSPPAAAMTVTPSSGDAPLHVTADASASIDTDTTPITTYSFDWGDGSATTGPQAGAAATHTYAMVGMYTVTVTVADSAGLSGIATRTVVVSSADAPPAAALSVSPSSGTAPLQVSADASASTDTDSTPIATYSFDWGDGSATTGPQAGATSSHTYAAPGTYTVEVTVSDSGGLSEKATRTVDVTSPVDAPPAAALSVSPTRGDAPLQVTGDASASTDTDSTPIATYSFDWGDGSSGTGQQAGATANHTYADPGTYTVTVTVTDTGGRSSSATRSVTATDAAPAAALSVSPTSGTAPLQVSADASASTDTDSTPIATYSFDWGDGSAGTGQQAGSTAGHTYADPGTYTVTMTVTDTGGQSSTATRGVTVSSSDAAPVAGLSVSPASVKVGQSVTADGSASTDTDSTPIATYSFDWGDGSAATGPKPGATATHTYGSAGTYTVTVTVSDTANQSSTATKQVTVSDDPPSAALASIPVSPTQLPLTADASSSTDADATGISTYRFNWGDGSASTGPQGAAMATHVYTTSGTYTVTVTVTDTAGNASTATAQAVVRQNLAANFGFETNLTGWNTSGGATGIMLARVAGGRSGAWSAQLSNPNATPATTLLNDSPNWLTTTASGTYAGSLWARADAAGATLTLRFREYSGTTLVGTTTAQVKLATGWQQITVTYAPVAPGQSTLDFNAYVSNAAAGSSFYADDAAVYLR